MTKLLVKSGAIGFQVTRLFMITLNPIPNRAIRSLINLSSKQFEGKICKAVNISQPK